jgi:molybdopterin-binding protein
VIRLEGLTAARGTFRIADVTLAVPAGGYLGLLGASGAGKTTLLEAIAGLVPATGRVVIDDRDVSREPAERRGIGLVTQDALLFPHLSVAGNVGFGLARRARAAAVAEAAELTGVATLLGRRPDGLSGGERQRVALARVLARRPRVLLLDEPLGALDTPVRRTIRRELATLHRRLGLTVVHVTHDVEEAIEQASLLAVMEAGRIVQVGPPAEVALRPATAGVATLLGTENLVPGVIEADGPTTATPFTARLRAGAIELRGLATREGPGHAAIRASDVSLSAEAVRSSALNQLRAVVREVASVGVLVRVTLDAGIPLVALVTRESAAALGLTPGRAVHAQIKATTIHLL